MADANDDDDQPVVLEGTDQAVVSDTVLPELPQGATKALADSRGIIECRYSLVKELEDAIRYRFVELFQFPTRSGVELNLPGHAAA
jgi:hypothetical protein